MEKRIRIKGILCVIICLAVILACSVPFIVLAHNYTDTASTDDGFTYLLRKPFIKAAVDTYTYDPSAGIKEIAIPEAYEYYPVRALGGYYGKGSPGPFHIVLKNVYINASVSLSEGSFSWYTEEKNLEVVYYDLVLNIGPNIQEIYAHQGGLATVTNLYVIRVYVDCAPDNPRFYSEDGVLYNKDGTVVDGLLYWNQSYR